MCIAYIKVSSPFFNLGNGMVMSRNESIMFEWHNIVVSKDTIARIASLGQVLFYFLVFQNLSKPKNR
jgi:hypothetical protein